MSWLGAAVELVGVGVGIWSSMEAADQAEETGEANAEATLAAAAGNAEISRYDASVAEMEAFRAEWRAGIQLKNHMIGVDRLLGAQKARLGKSGIALGKGSAGQIVKETAALAARDSQMIINNGKTARDTALSAAGRYRLLADKGLRDAAATASIITHAASDQSSMYLMQGAATAIQGIGQFADNSGWFS